MPVKLRIEGLREFAEELRKLPTELRDEARDIVKTIADDAAADMATAYSKFRVSGNLERGLRTFLESSPFGARAVVQNVAPHAHLFEVGIAGTRKRKAGPGNVFIPRAIFWRHVMRQRLVEVVESRGFTVTGVI